MLTLQRALLGTVGVALLAGLVPAGFALDGLLASTLEARARSDLALAPMVFGDRQHVSADAMMMRAKDFAHMPALASALARGDRRSVREVAERAAIDLGGVPVVIAANGEAWSGPASSSATDALVRRTRGGEMPVATIADDSTLRDVALAPVQADGRWLGAAGLSNTIDAEQTAVLAGLTRSDVIVMSSSRSVAASTLATTSPALLLAVQQFVAPPPRGATPNATVVDLHAGTQRYIAVSVPIAGVGTIVFLRDLDVELAVLPRLRRIALLSALAALLCALAVGAVLAARLARPVRQLALAADAIARGEFDGPIPRANNIAVREVSRVAGAFAAMRAALSARLAELRDANVALAEGAERLSALQADLVQRERLAATGRLVAQLAHEIRNPVASLRNCLELIHRRVGHDVEAREFTELAIEELLRMHDLAEQMLDFNRPHESGGGSCRPAQVARDVRALLSAGAPADAPAIECRLSECATGDEAAAIARDALKQVLLNLVQNAQEAIASSPRLTDAAHATATVHARGLVVIQVDADENTVTVSVTDDGPGIDPSLLPRIFDPFFTTKSAMHGVGLGLFVAEGLVRTAGGRLTASSPADTGGVTFRAEFPRVDTGREQPAMPALISASAGVRT